MDVIVNTWHTLLLVLVSPFQHGFWPFVFKFIPDVLFFEMPVYLFILMGILRYYLRHDGAVPESSLYYPKVSCIVLGYSEGDDIRLSILSLAEQIYPGHIEILAMIDGAHANMHTYEAAKSLILRVQILGNRTLRIIPKWQRAAEFLL